MSIPPRFMQELRDRLTLSDIVGKRVRLTRAGHEFKGCCPFHHEKTPSFYVNDDKQFYHCFGCGAHGDAVGFIMQNDNLSFIDAIEMLAAEAGLQVPQQTPQDIQKAKKQKDLHQLMDEAAGYFQDCLRQPAHQDAYNYLTERGMSDELLAAFRIGFAPADQFALHKFLKDKGYSEQQMIEVGLVRESKRGTAPYAFFRDRVMFPVTDKRGRVVAFGGRILPEHMRPPSQSGFKPPKYINSSETALFHKGRMLYNESQARQAAADGQPVVVVEGYVDVIACSSAGFKGAVAPLGTALTDQQIMILWKMIPDRRKVPVLCFDGDEAGRRAAARAYENILPLLQPDHSACFAFLPEGQDPDSLIRGQGAQAFKAVIDSAMPLVDFIWQHHVGQRSLETPEERAGLSKVLEEEAARIPDRSVQQYYRQTFRDRLYHYFRNQRGGRDGYKKGGGAAESLRLRKPAYAKNMLRQQILLAAMINYPALFESEEEALGRMQVDRKPLDLLRQEIMNTLGDDPALDSAALQRHLVSCGFEEELGLLLSSAVYTHAGFARPGGDEQKVREAWRDMMHEMQNEAAREEQKAMAQAYVADPSIDNEERLMALHRMNKYSEG